jgi:hypothetical protein
MKKKLFMLLLCVFAVVSANAWKVTVNGTTVTIDGQEDGLPQNWADLIKGSNNGTANYEQDILSAETLIFKGNIGQYGLSQIDQGKGKTRTNGETGYAATTVDFRQATFPETVESTIEYQRWNPTTGQTETAHVDKTSNAMSFQYFNHIETAYLASVKTICQNTFMNNFSMTTTFEIPESVKFIAQHGIDDTPITSITIPSTVDYIEYQAFQNDVITNLIDVTVEGYTAAAVGAFDKDITVGQTESEGKIYATLHFPVGADAYFQNQEHTLDQATSLDKGKFHDWLDTHYAAASTCTNPNGWKEFINSGSGDPIPVPGNKKVVLRTFSDKVARLVPLNFRAYIVTDVTRDGDDKPFVLTLQQIFAIPAYTGVILYGSIDENESSYDLTHIAAWDPGQDDYVAPYTRNSTTVGSVSIKNYLVPTVEATTIYPCFKDMTASDWSDATWKDNKTSLFTQHSTGSTVTDRNFIMSQFSGTSLKEAKNVSAEDDNNYIGFFRTKKTSCGPNKAFLSLPVGKYTLAEGAEALVVRPEEPDDMKFRYSEWYKNFYSTGNWGKRAENLGILKAKFAGEIFEEDVTGISNVNTEKVSDNSYYTLEGVKVTQPQKGVYVKNGKKIIK